MKIMSKNLVIVESPAKAKTIERYLGSDFHVLASVGHIRKDTKVDVDNNFSVTYEIDPDHKKIISELKKAVKSSDKIWLATDEDREGEAISWHLLEVLKLPENTNRITFHEITKPALEEAIKHPRTIDMNMVSSQQARQTLDMLVGYDLSGVVRRKVPGAISAGRVQSPALRLIVEREREIEAFESKSAFKLSGTFAKSNKSTSAKSDTDTSTTSESFQAVVEKTTFPDTESVNALLESLKNNQFYVSNITKTEGKKSNPVPLTTAMLQIEANSRLGFSARTTMSAAQGLYQAGHITYHRTDSLNLSSQAIGQIAHYIEETYGKNYLHVRHFKTKSASAQEAHEAIRPSHIEKVTAGKNDYEKKLYQLIRSRTLATQMENAKIAKTTVELKPKSNSLSSATTPAANSEPSAAHNIDNANGNSSSANHNINDANPKITFTAKGETVIFDGFLKVYGNAKDVILPPLEENDLVDCLEITARESFSNPPARYTEGSLVKKLEELGIGRPSTYASIMSAIQVRGYVKRGESEGKNRKIRNIILKGKEIISETTTEKTGATKGKLLPTPVGELVSDFLGEHFKSVIDYDFTAKIETELDQIAEAKIDRVKMLSDFYGPFSEQIKLGASVDRYNAANLLGVDPKTKKNVYAKIGRNGGFIQLGENEKDSGEKPRFAPLPKNTSVKTVTFEQALRQLELPALPRSLGAAKDGTEIIAASGPFGPYLKAGSYNIAIKGKDPYTITLAEAEPLYEEKKASILADYGEIQVINGRYGPYVKGPGRRNFAKIPKDKDPKKLTKAECEQILKDKPARRTTKASRTAKTSKATKTTKRKAAARKKQS